MTQLLALSLSIGVLGAIWAFLALGPLSAFFLVWAGFIAWGCFFHSGADNKALTKTIVGNAYGAFVAWVALLIIVNVPVPALGTVWTAIVVGVTVFCLVIVASVDLLSVVPANVYGYAALVAYSLPPAIGRAIHRSTAELGFALVRQPSGLAHRLDGDRGPVWLCLGPSREGRDPSRQTRNPSAAPFGHGPDSGTNSVPEVDWDRSVFLLV
jgi:hypothetical protein